MKAPPSPVSCRSPQTDRALQVTIRSHQVTSLFQSIIKASKRGRYMRLVVHPEESHEIVSFSKALVEKRQVMQTLRVVNESDQRIMREVTAGINPFLATEEEDDDQPPPPSMGGLPILFLKADRLADGVQRDFLEGQNHKGNPWPLVLACFPTTPSLERTMGTWPAAMRSLFTETLTWPALKDRQHDREGIATEICKQLAQDGKALQLKHDAFELIRHMKAPNVSALYREIRKARQSAIDLGRSWITAHDFDIARKQSEPPRPNHAPASTPPPQDV